LERKLERIAIRLRKAEGGILNKSHQVIGNKVFNAKERPNAESRKEEERWGEGVPGFWVGITTYV